jgi:formylglycine-generating enzyme required for sulfatase activity
MRVAPLVVATVLVCSAPVVLLCFDERVENGDPATPPEGMVLVPAGTFAMGTEGDLDDNPAHDVSVDAFLIDRHEVTNAEYLAFCKTTGGPLPEFWGKEAFHSGADFPDHPVVGVSWLEAKAYAEWRGRRLPTEAEWEYAARGGLVGKEYPNGEGLTPEEANYTDSKLGGTVPVGSFPPNGYGLHDMAGNVGEWVEDRYGAGYYRESPRENARGPEKGRFRVFRGGGWHSGPYCNRVIFRNALPPNWRDFNVGFRCAMDAPTPAS